MKLDIFKKSFLTIAVIALSLTIFCFALISQAYNFNEESGLNLSADSSGFETSNPTSLTDIISNVILVFLSFLGVIFFAYLIYGGITWMTADGNEAKVKKANDIIMNSLYGLIITMATFVISWLVITNVAK
jgi:ABC-type Fe3+ transport system permease subunit